MTCFSLWPPDSTAFRPAARPEALSRSCCGLACPRTPAAGGCLHWKASVSDLSCERSLTAMCALGRGSPGAASAPVTEGSGSVCGLFSRAQHKPRRAAPAWRWAGCGGGPLPEGLQRWSQEAPVRGEAPWCCLRPGVSWPLAVKDSLRHMMKYLIWADSFLGVRVPRTRPDSRTGSE